MATTLYWRDGYDENGVSNSTALPDGTDNSLSIPGPGTPGTLSLTADSSNTRVSINTLGQLTRQSGRFATFVSDPLDAQTISAQTWTIQYRDITSNTASNAYLAASIYVYRPSTSSVVGYVYDSAAELGTAWTTNITTAQSEVSGSSVSVLAGDELRFEAWYTAIQSKSKTYTVSLEWGSTGYIETPQDLTFLSAVAAKTYTYAWIIK
jgi:hypothetical protein